MKLPLPSGQMQLPRQQGLWYHIYIQYAQVGLISNSNTPFLGQHKLHKTIRSEVDQLYHKVKEESGWMTEWHLRSQLFVKFTSNLFL